MEVAGSVGEKSVGVNINWEETWQKITAENMTNQWYQMTGWSESIGGAGFQIRFEIRRKWSKGNTWTGTLEWQHNQIQFLWFCFLMSEDYQDSLVFILEHMLNMVQEILQDKFHVDKKFLQRLELQMTKRGCHFWENWMDGFRNSRETFLKVSLYGLYLILR